MSHCVRHISLAALPVLVLVACNREPAPPPEADQTASTVNETASTSVASPSAITTLTRSDGAPAGSATLEETPNGLSVTIAAIGLPPGVHGAHLHAIGKCDGPKFESAGPHWNPTSRKHGRDNPEGLHLGDLSNIGIGADGSGHSTFTIGTASLTVGPDALLDTDGASLVIHAKPDDYKTDPSGNSGDRIACGVISAAK